MGVLKKIKKANKINGYGIELATAQLEDYVAMRETVNTLQKDVASIKTEQAVQGGKLDLIIQRLNSPVEEDRLHGAYWRALATVMKSPKMWIVLIVLMFLIAMTGNEIKHLLGWIPATVGA